MSVSLLNVNPITSSILQANASGSGWGIGNIPLWTWTCFLDGVQFEPTTCCDSASSCVNPLYTWTRTCLWWYSCENSISNDPFIRINKNVDKTIAIIGETVTYTITVNNIWSWTATGITFNDDFPAWYNATWSNTGKLQPNKLKYTWFDLEAHTSLTFIVTWTFTSAGTRTNSGYTQWITTGANCINGICMSNTVSTTILPPITGQCGTPANNLLYNFTGNGSSLLSTSDWMCDSGSVINFNYSNHQRTWNCSGQNGAPHSSQCNASENYCGDGITGNSTPVEQCDGQIWCTSVCEWKTLSCDDLAFSINPTQIFINETWWATWNINDRYTVTTINRWDGVSGSAWSPVANHQYTQSWTYTWTLTFTHKYLSQTWTCKDTINVINTWTLSILKTIDDNTVEEWEIVTYTITINNWTLTTQSGQIEDILPTTFKLISPSATPFPMNFNLSAWASMSYSFSGYFNMTWLWTNTWSIIWNTDGCAMPGSICTSSVSTNVYSSGLIISKTWLIYSGWVASKSGWVGQFVQFIVTLVNTSIHTIKNIIVHDIMTPWFFGDVIEAVGTTWDAATKNRYIPSLSGNQSTTLVFSGYFTWAWFKINTWIITSGYKDFIIWGASYGSSTNYITVWTASDSIRQTGCKATFNPSNIYTLWTGIAQIGTNSYRAYVMNVGSTPWFIWRYDYTSTQFAWLMSWVHYNAFIPSNTNGLFKITNRNDANLGDEINYAMIYINNTNTTQTNLNWVDLLPPWYFIRDIQWTYNPIGWNWTIWTLDPQWHRTLFFEWYYELPGTKNNGVTANGLSSNATNQIWGTCIPTNWSNGGGGWGSDEPILPELWINKSTDILYFTNSPQAIQYHLLIGNSGASITDGSIIVRDYLPASFTWLSSVYYTDYLGNSGNVNYQYLTNNNLIIISGLSLAYNQTGLITISWILSGSYTSGENIINSGTIYYYSGWTQTWDELTPPLYINNISYATSTYIMSTIATWWATGLSVSKSVSPITGSIGQTFVYTITLTNTGMYTINDVIVSDPLSQLILNGFTGIVANPSTGSFNSTNGLWEVSQIQPNQTFTLTISGYFTFSWEKPNTAILSGCQSIVGCEGTATGFVFDTGAKITKTVDVTTGCVWWLITYTIIVSNKWIQNINNLDIVDILPIWFVVSSSGSTGPNIVSPNGIGKWTILNFWTTNQVFTITWYFTSTGTKINTWIISWCNDLVTTDCISTVSVDITDDRILCPLTWVRINKSVSLAMASIGEIIAYTITVQNLNQYIVYDLFVNEILPLDFTGIVAGTSTGSYNTATNIRYIPGIDSWSFATLILSGYFSNTGTKVNVAILSGCNGSWCTGVATWIITESPITGLCGFYSGTTTSYGAQLFSSGGYCSGWTISWFIQMTWSQQWYCSGLNGGSSAWPCSMITPSCGDGIIQTGNEACDTALPLTTGQTSCNNSCKTLYQCASTGQSYGGFIFLNPNNPSVVNNSCCTGLVWVRSHDPAFLPDASYTCVDPRIDLALTKTLATAQTWFFSWDIIQYTITVINQWNIPTTDIQIIDYIPNGLVLDTWNVVSRNIPNFTDGRYMSWSNAVLTGRYWLWSGMSLQIPLYLRVTENANGVITNAAELLYSSWDIDSTSDNNPVNDCYSWNNNINWNALLGWACSPSTDEDDYDREDVTILLWACSNWATNPPLCDICASGSVFDPSSNSCEIYSDGWLSWLTISKIVSPQTWTTNGNTWTLFTYTVSITNNSTWNISWINVLDYITILSNLGFTGYSVSPSYWTWSANSLWNIPFLWIWSWATLTISWYFTSAWEKPNTASLSGCFGSSAYCNSTATWVVIVNPCTNGATNPPLCNVCTSGYHFNTGTNSCVIDACTNWATNPPLCNVCSSGYVFNANTNQCVPYLLSITKQWPPQSTYIINQDILYLIQITNHGPQVATWVVIQDYLPDGFALNFGFMNTLYPTIQWISSPSINGSTMTWTIPTISSGQVITLFVYGKFTESHGVGTGTNTGAIISWYCSNCTGVDSKHVDISGPEGYLLSINKTSSRWSGVSGSVQSPITYTITITNTGYKSADNISISDIVPAWFTGSATTSIGTFSILWWTWNLNLGIGQSATLTLNGYYTSSWIKTNTATITSWVCLSGSCSSSVTNTVTDVPYNLTIAKSVVNSNILATTGIALINDNLTYTVTITNQWPQTANGIIVSDLMPSWFTLNNFIPYQLSTGIFNTNTMTWNITSLAANQSAILQLLWQYTTDGIKTNYAVITSWLAFNKTGLVTINVLACTNGVTCVQTWVCNTGYHAQVYTGTPTIDTWLLCIGGTTTGLIKTSTGWTWNCNWIGWWGNTNGCYLSISSGNSNTWVNCGATGQVICTTGNACMTGLLNQWGICVSSCSSGYNLSGTSCIACGATGQVICTTGNQCITGLVNSGWMCTIPSGTGNNCGLLGQVICTTGNACMTGLVNQWGICVSSCSSGYNLSGTSCIACGATGQVICTTGSQCMTGLVNSGWICVTTGMNSTGTTNLSWLRINKTVSRLYALPGETVTWFINYGVYGTGVYQWVTVDDILPVGWEFVSTSLYTGYSYTWWVMSYAIGTLTGAYTGSFTLVMKIGTGVATWTQLVNTVSSSASGRNTVIGTAVVNVWLTPIVYIPTNLGWWWTYDPVPLPTQPNQTVITTIIPEIITKLVKKTRVLLNQWTQEYIPFYTQPLEAIKKNIQIMPHTGVISMLDIIMKILDKIL